MARYIKVNPLVAKYLNLEDYRNKLKDGNYLLWQADMTAFGPLPRLADTLERIGAISLLPHEAREEQYGITLRPLPVATDPQFVIETPAEEEPETEGSGETETPTDETAAETETATGDGEGTGESETTEEETPANGDTAEETEESNEETEEIGSGDVGSVEDVLNPNNTEE